MMNWSPLSGGDGGVMTMSLTDDELVTVVWWWWWWCNDDILDW